MTKVGERTSPVYVDEPCDVQPPRARLVGRFFRSKLWALGTGEHGPGVYLVGEFDLAEYSRKAQLEQNRVGHTDQGFKLRIPRGA